MKGGVNMTGHNVPKDSLNNPNLLEIVVLGMPNKDAVKLNPEKIKSLLYSAGQDYNLDERNKISVSYDYFDCIKKALRKNVKPVDLKKLNYPAIIVLKFNNVELPALESSFLLQIAGIDYAIQNSILYAGRQFFS